MVKKQKYTLSIEEDFDFGLIGICCHQSDYRLCWSMNEALGLQLAKAQEPYIVSGKKGGVASSHSCYEWYDEENLIHYYLLKNKDGIQYILPEKAQIDYLLVIKGAEMEEVDNLLTQLKSISSILTAFSYDPYELKSRKHLIF